MPTRHVHRDDADPQPSPGYSVVSAYARLVTSLVGAVLITTALWPAIFPRQFDGVAMWYPELPRDFSTYISTVWEIEATGPVPLDLLLLAIAYLSSPWVLGMLVSTGILTVVLSSR